MKKYRWLAIFVVLSLCGCGAISKTATGPDGRALHYIRCGGIQNSFADCLEKAGELCPQGYDVHSSMDDIVPSVLGGMVNKRNLVIQCRDSGGKIF